ncbi:Integrase [compost metagenome]
MQAGPLLAKWARDLAAGRPLAVVDGTKGGRFRLVHPANVEALQGVVARALAVSRERGGVLIAKPELKKAVDYVDRHGRKAGLTGDQSFHSLRYAFASEQIAHYLAQGYTQKQAEAMTSADLGHGTQRTDFVRTVYSKK